MAESQTIATKMNATRENNNNNRRRGMLNWCSEKSLETTVTASEKGDFDVVTVDPTIEGRRKRLIDFTKTKGPSIGKSGNFMTRSWRAIRKRSLRKAEQKAQRRASSERVARKNSLLSTQLQHCPPSSLSPKELSEQPTKRKSASMSNLSSQPAKDDDDDERIEFMFRRQPRERTRRLSTQARIKELFQAISDKHSSSSSSDEADRKQLFSWRTRKLSGQHVRNKSKSSQRRRIVEVSSNATR